MQMPRPSIRHLLALSLLAMVAAPSAAHGAKPGPVVQVRDKDRLACSGVIVTPRFVLTSARCAAPGGKRLSLTRVQARGGNLRDPLGVAAIIKQPGGELALLQLTSSTRLPKAQLLSPKASRSTRAGAAGRAVGWSTKKRVVEARGRLVAGARCAGSKSARCLETRRAAAVPAARCGDARGAGLFVTTGGKARLAGIGSLSRRGCGRPARLRFAPLDARATDWIAKTIAAATTPAGSPVLAPFVGTWAGSVHQRPRLNATYRTQVTVAPGATTDGVAATTSYSKPPAPPYCGGELTFKEALADGGLVFTERITSGMDYCVSGGNVILSRVSGYRAISYTWHGGDRFDRTDGVLEKIR
jgi:hypothetical protein